MHQQDMSREELSALHKAKGLPYWHPYRAKGYWGERMAKYEHAAAPEDPARSGSSSGDDEGDSGAESGMAQHRQHICI